MVSKAVVGIIAVAIIAAGAYFFLLQPPAGSFEEGFSAMEAAFLAEGISIRNLDLENLDKMASLSESKASALKSKISSIRGSYANTTFKSVAGVYLGLLEAVELQTRINGLDEGMVVAGLADPCGQVSKVKEINFLEGQRIQKLESAFTKINDFVSNHPAESEIAGFEQIEINLETSKNNLEESQVYTAELEALCG